MEPDLGEGACDERIWETAPFLCLKSYTQWLHNSYTFWIEGIQKVTWLLTIGYFWVLDSIILSSWES